MTHKMALSVIVPTLNEAENIPKLFMRIENSLSSRDIPYEIIVIDDNSTDRTIEVAGELASDYNARVLLKRGKPGKAYSLLEGFVQAKYPVVCMIDADLQYPPEEIAPMYTLLTEKDADVVISERHDNETSHIRKMSSKVFNLIFARMLFGIGYDTQSGLKLFKKDILDDFDMTPSPWSFDLEFLVRSLENKRKIISHPIPFADRDAGVTKVKLLSTTMELAKASVKLRLSTSTRKVKEGNQANLRFLKRTFPAMYVALVACSMFMFSTPKTEALSIPIQDVVPSIVSKLLEDSPVAIINSPNPNNSKPAEASNPDHKRIVANTIAPQPSSPVPNTDTASKPASDTQVARNETEPAIQLANATPESNDNWDGGNAVQTTNANLSAATASIPSSAYANGYPEANLDPETKNKLTTIAQSTLITGGLCIALVSIIKTGSLVKSRIS